MSSIISEMYEKGIKGPSELMQKDYEDGIKVYTRKTDEFPIKEFKATTTLSTDFNTVLKILANIEDYPNWMADCTYSKTIKTVNENERYDYVKTHVPWPLTDRDMIWHFNCKTDLEKEEYVAISTSKPDYIKEMKGLERLKKGRGRWELKGIDNKVKITYQFAADPGVAVPNWIINMFLVDGPFETLTNLKKLVE
jgi:ribosome-associated toxin RatA of RatAB toxin-antitoxin module